MISDKERTKGESSEKLGSHTTILFDLAGVIVKSGFWDWVKSHTPDETQHDQYRDMSDAVDSGKITDDEFSKQLGKLSHRSPMVVSNELDAAFTPIQDTVEILKELKEQGYPLILVTNFSQVRANVILDKYDLRKYFDRIFISSQMGLIKPSPEFFQTVNGILGKSPTQEIFIDDSERNIQAAKKEGITESWHFTGAQDLRQRFEQAHILVPKQLKA
jgi:HAD superfamily hydrolase (TIGR01509 family)